MIIKMNNSDKNIQKELNTNKEFNKYIAENVEDRNNWIIYANDNYFSKENRINEFDGIMIKYNDFVMTDNVIILTKKTNI